VEEVAALRTPAGAHALEAAAALTGADPVSAVARLRRAGIVPDLAAAALTQAGLRERATTKFPEDAPRMFFTRAGLEQATRAVVARRRAARLASAGVDRVADLGCGIGSDAIAFARSGLRVLAVEADPATAAIARANMEVLGLPVEVVTGDATSVDLSGWPAAFCDPSRRGDGRRRFDPRAFSPPWSFVEHLIGTVPHVVVKLAPGLDHSLIPPGAEAEWVSVDGDLVEAALWTGALATQPRRATVIRGDRVDDLTGTGDRRAPVGEIGRFLYAPDPAVVRAHLVAELCLEVGGWLADPNIAYVFTDTVLETPYARRFAVEERLPFGVKHLRAALRERGIGRLEILKRGVAVEPDRLRLDLRLQGKAEASLILLRVGDTPTALLCRAEGYR
jgi:SAM-dependent methyltransferase